MITCQQSQASEIPKNSTVEGNVKVNHDNTGHGLNSENASSMKKADVNAKKINSFTNEEPDNATLEMLDNYSVPLPPRDSLFFPDGTPRN